MRLLEELVLLGPALVLLVLFPLFYWTKIRRRQWVTMSGIQLAKDWHKPDKANLAHLRCLARTEIIRILQKGSVRSYPLIPLDDLSNKIGSMEEKVEEAVRPIWTPWLCALVFWEMLQFWAVPFAARVHWDRESSWKVIPKIFHSFLPYPSHEHTRNFLTWAITAPLYLGIFCACWLAVFGLCVRYLSRLKEHRESLGEIFVKVLEGGRWLLLTTKEAIFDFGLLFILAGIFQSCLTHEGRLEGYWPSCLILLVVYYGAFMWGDEGARSVTWVHDIVHFFFPDHYPHLIEKLPSDDQLYVHRVLGTSNQRELQRLQLHFPSHQRPVCASRWIFFSGYSKLIIGVLYVLAHFEDFWAWMLLSISSVLFAILLHQNFKHGPSTFQWINTTRSIGLIAALWSNLCAFLAQGLHHHPDVTYAFTPSLVFAVGLGVIFGIAPFCIGPVIHSYFKFAALGRIAAIQDALTRQDGVIFRTGLNKQNASAKLLLINYELWTAWVKKNALLFHLRPIELSMQDKINICSKKSLQQCLPASEDCAELQTIHKIKDWMHKAEMVIDPEKDIELGLRVPDDEYLSFEDGAPIFTGKSYSFGQKCEDFM